MEQLRADKLVEGRNFSLSLIGLFQYYSLIPLSIFGLIKLKAKKRPLLPILTIPIITTLLAAASMGTTRYRVSAEISIIILSSFGIQFFFEKLRSFRVKRDQISVSVPEVEKC